MSEEGMLARGPQEHIYDWFAHAIATVATYPDSFEPSRLDELTTGMDILQRRGPNSADLMQYFDTTPESGNVRPWLRAPEHVDSMAEAKRVHQRHIEALGWKGAEPTQDWSRPTQVSAQEMAARLATRGVARTSPTARPETAQPTQQYASVTHLSAARSSAAPAAAPEL